MPHILVQMLQSAQQAAHVKGDALAGSAVAALSTALARGRFRSELPEAELRRVLAEPAQEGPRDGAAATAVRAPRLDAGPARRNSTSSPDGAMPAGRAGGDDSQRLVTSLLQQGYLIRDDRHGTPLLRLAMPGAGSVVRAAALPPVQTLPTASPRFPPCA